MNFHSRCCGHVSDLRAGKHHNRHLQGAYNLYGEDAFVFEVICVVDGDKLERTKKEQEFFDAYADKWDQLYNFCRSASAVDRSVWSRTPEETTAKLSAASKKKWEQHREKYLQALERSRTPEARRKKSESLLAHYANPENREKKRSAVKKMLQEHPDVFRRTTEQLMEYNKSEEGREVRKRNTKRLWEEKREMMLAAQQRPETKEKQRLAHLGKKTTDKQKEMATITGRRRWAEATEQEREEQLARIHAGRDRYNRSDRIGKTYIFLDSSGSEVVIKNLSKFCRENDLVYSCMRRVAEGYRKSHKGWTFVRKIDEP
jgi:hypothetical protein